MFFPTEQLKLNFPSSLGEDLLLLFHFLKMSVWTTDGEPFDLSFIQDSVLLNGSVFPRGVPLTLKQCILLQDYYYNPEMYFTDKDTILLASALGLLEISASRISLLGEGKDPLKLAHKAMTMEGVFPDAMEYLFLERLREKLRWDDIDEIPEILRHFDVRVGVRDFEDLDDFHRKWDSLPNAHIYVTYILEQSSTLPRGFKSHRALIGADSFTDFYGPQENYTFKERERLRLQMEGPEAAFLREQFKEKNYKEMEREILQSGRIDKVIIHDFWKPKDPVWSVKEVEASEGMISRIFRSREELLASFPNLRLLRIKNVVHEDNIYHIAQWGIPILAEMEILDADYEEELREYDDEDQNYVVVKEGEEYDPAIFLFNGPLN